MATSFFGQAFFGGEFFFTGTTPVVTTDTHDGFFDEQFRKRDAEIKEQRDSLRRVLLAAVERVTGKPPPLDAPLKQLASIARKSESFDYRGTLAHIALLDSQIAELAVGRARRAAESEDDEEESFLMMMLS